MDSFAGKVAVVTGGASGIGRSLVKELLAEGAKVVIADVEQSALNRVLAAPAKYLALSPMFLTRLRLRPWLTRSMPSMAPATCCSIMPAWRHHRPMSGRQP